MSGRRLLIVNADDFGRSPGINDGIIRAHREGIVTSTTLMVNTPWAEVAIETSRSVPELAIGLHLNFCYGRPVSNSSALPSLVDDMGDFRTSIDDIRSVASSDDIERETLAQIERFEALVGRNPSHLDSHKYLHSYEPFMSVVASIAAARYLPVRATSETERNALRRSGVRTTDYFEGRFHGLDGEGVDEPLLARTIRELREGTTELMCHPGLVDRHIANSSYTRDRERELDVLRSARIRKLIEDEGIQLARFDDI